MFIHVIHNIYISYLNTHIYAYIYMYIYILVLMYWLNDSIVSDGSKLRYRRELVSSNIIITHHFTNKIVTTGEDVSRKNYG